MIGLHGWETMRCIVPYYWYGLPQDSPIECYTVFGDTSLCCSQHMRAYTARLNAILIYIHLAKSESIIPIIAVQYSILASCIRNRRQTHITVSVVSNPSYMDIISETYFICTMYTVLMITSWSLRLTLSHSLINVTTQSLLSKVICYFFCAHSVP